MTLLFDASVGDAHGRTVAQAVTGELWKRVPDMYHAIRDKENAKTALAWPLVAYWEKTGSGDRLHVGILYKHRRGYYTVHCYFPVVH